MSQEKFPYLFQTLTKECEVDFLRHHTDNKLTHYYFFDPLQLQGVEDDLS